MKYFFSIFLLFFLFACGEKTPINPSQPNVFAVTSFKMSKGKQWKYLRIDRLSGTEKRDTITMEVVEDSIDTAGNQYFWLSFSNHQQQIIDSQFVYYTPDSLVFRDKNGGLVDKFKMPLQDSLEWKGWNINDIYKVGYFNSQITSYNITHDSVVSVNRNFAISANHQLTKNFFFKKNTGIVNLYFYEFQGTIKQKDETWVLIEG